MKLLTDQDVYAVTVTLLRTNNHDVATAAEKGLSQASDTVLLQTAAQDGRILVTRDRDFGALVFAPISACWRNLLADTTDHFAFDAQ